MPRPGKRQRSRLSGRQSSLAAALAPFRALIASLVVGRVVLPLLMLRGATSVDAGTQRIAGLLGSTGVKRPCLY